MADAADLAQGHIENEVQRSLEIARKAAQAVPGQTRTHCDDCGEPLEPHRISRGRCVPCQNGREHRMRSMACGV